ncbi:MAG: aldehyde dehydrogenase EutE [Deltaproteobacteria bacterium]|nr:aldehyde dehydrogenase EutE [Deltaproteobacteria bacterium]
MQINESQINTIIERVVENLGKSTPHPNPLPRHYYTAGTAQGERENKPSNQPGVFDDIDHAIKSARQAFLDYQDVSVAKRKKIIHAIRELCLEHLEDLARIAVEETKLGRYEDKLQKNRLAIEKTPGVEDVFPQAFSGDYGLSIQEPAPFGVIGSITPCTNPTETIICNGIGMIAGGNAVFFNPHPTAKRTSAYVTSLINKAVISEDGPINLLTTIANPTIESAQYMMKHPGIRLLVVTGGPAVVRQAMNSGKRVIAAGPGHPPVVVDETADIEKAGRDIVKGAGLDNNIVCVIEKIIIAVNKIADELKEALVTGGGVELNGLQAQRLAKIIIDPDGKHPNKNWVGKDIQLILKEIGLEVGPEKRIAFADVLPDHPFATVEMLLPVIGFVRAKDVDEAIEIAYKLEDGCFHTAGMHSKNIDNLHKMARKMNTSIFVKNAPFYAGLGLGGEGPTSFTIASPTGEGLTTARNFTRMRRCVVAGHFRIT